MRGKTKASVILVVCAAAAALVLGAYILARHTAAHPAGAQLTTSRPSPGVCVDRTEGPSAAAADRQAVEDALDRIASEYAALSAAQVGTNLGCVPGRLLSEPAPLDEVELRRRIFDPPGIRSPDLPNPNAVLVYLLPRATFEEYFPSHRWVIAPEEMSCSGHECHQVTTGIYLPVDRADEDLYQALKRAYGLETYPPEPAPDLAPCDSASAPTWCRGIPEALFPKGN